MSELHNYLKGDASTPKAPGGVKEWSGTNPGPYLGIVKNNTDPARMGRLKVYIPSLAKTSDPAENQLITCEYLAPFYGAKGGKYARGAGTEYTDSQHSYGFWAIPPDLETKVLVIFAEGKMEQAYWIGCVQDPYTNHMTPGIASSTNTNDALDGTFEGADAGFQTDKKSKYGTENLPSGELNRNRIGALQNNNYDSIPKPIHPLADVLLEQGLSADDTRGNTSSSARRETPSQVFGISTPGRKDTSTTKVKVGAKDSTAKDYVSRKIGHTFVMDDGDQKGDNQLTRLRTASGHQLLMHDTAGVVYLANGSGKAFLEMDKDGTISLYSDAGINIRSGQDFNIHSDKNINFHARGGINFTSETNVALNAEGYVFAMGQKGILNSSQGGSVRNYAQDGITSYTPGPQLHGAGGVIHHAGAQVHMNSVGASSVWGPGWLKPEAIGIKVTNGEIDIDDEKPLRPYRDSKDDRVVGVDEDGNDIIVKGAVPNKINNKTTVSEFVTHEPYDRQSSTARKKKYVNDVIAKIKAENPDLTSQQIKDIKIQLLKQESITAVADQLGKLVKLNDKINLPITELKNLVSQAQNIESLIKQNIKTAAINFVMGSITSQVSSFINTSGFNFKFSDRRLKEEIRFIGKSPAGVNVYSFKYKQLPGRYIGVMAQEVPWARHLTDTGYYAVNYSKVDVEFRRLN